MVQAANLGKHDDPTGFRPLDWPRLRRILVQPKVSSALVDIDYVEGMLTLFRQASATIGRQAGGRQSGLAAADPGSASALRNAVPNISHAVTKSDARS